jgi:hypothetical protein
MYRDTANVEYKIYDYADNNWSHRNSDKRLKEKFGSHTGKEFSRFTTKDSCSLKLEVRAVGITAGSGREAPGRKGMWQDT